MNTSRIRRNVFIPIAIGLLLLTGIIAASLHWYQSQNLKATVAERLAIVSKAFNIQVNSDVELLDGILGFIKDDPSLQRAFMAGDRDALLKTALPIFQDLRKNHRVTHFYFSDPNRVCFLRVHESSRHGDVIDRYTTTATASSGEPTHGLELGPLGTFTVRVVHPWTVGNRLIGYIELGEEINHVLPRIKSLVGVELIAMIDKDHLDKATWEAGMKVLKRESSWDNYDKFVIVDSTMPRMSKSIEAILETPHLEQDSRIYDASLDTRLLRGGFSPLADASGIDVGHLFALVDVTKDALALKNALWVGFVGALVFSGLMACLFWAYLGSLDRALAAATNELREARAGAEQTAARLRKLSQAVEQSPAGILIATVDGFLEYGNTGIIKLTGYATNELVGKHIQILQSDAYSPNFYKRIQALLLRGETWCGEVCFRKRNGETFWGNATFAPILDTHNVVSHVVAVVMDMSESKRAAAAMLEYTDSLAKAGIEIRKQSNELAARETKYRTLFDSSHDAIMTLTPEEGFLECNPAAAKLFGCKDCREFAAFSPGELSPERQADGELSALKAQEMMSIALANGSHFFEWTHKRHDGREFPATVLLTRMELEGKTILQATVRDVSEERRLIEALRIAKTEAAAANHAG